MTTRDVFLSMSFRTMMMSEAVFSANDPEVARLALARGNEGVIKYRLERIRTARAGVVILGLEGPDDKIVFSRWIHRVREDLHYEPFVCDGKMGVAKLKRVANRDLTGLKEIVFFLVDRDFDDLRDFEDDYNLYCTDAYSVENYLVGRDLLDGILRDEFPCHERPEIRERILEKFDDDYTNFLAVTAQVNARIFVARKLHIQINKLSSIRLSSLALVGIGSVSPSMISPNELVIFERNPKQSEIASLFPEFCRFEREFRYRGKFCWMFFQGWIRLLAEEYAACVLGLFHGLDGDARPHISEITLGSLAAKSRIPTGFKEFVNSI